MNEIAEFGRKTNICFDCKNACGGCPWTEIDPSTDRPRFEPVEGWTAEETYLLDSNKTRSNNRIKTYHITACPKFVQDEPRQSCGDGFSLEQIEVLLRRWRRTGEL